ncbi:MAG: hypothetical protein Q8N37_00590 [bacterium]|nr:hypothetical protein [bacterium]
MGNDGIGIRVMSKFASDQKLIPAILSIINSTEAVCIDKPFCDETLQKETTCGRVFIIEKNEDQKQTAIGVVLAHTIIKNSFGIFSIAFEKSMRNNQEMIASAIESFKECAFKEMHLSLITLMVSSGDGLPGILLKKGFVNGIDKTNTDFYSISNNGSVLTNLTGNGHSAEIPKPDEKEIKKLTIALKKSEEICQMAYTEIEGLKKALGEAREKGLPTDKELLNQVAELERRLDQALKEKGKFKEWLDEKNLRLEEAQKTIADRNATIKRLDGEIIKLSLLLGEKTQKVNELTKITDKPSEPAPETGDLYKEIIDLKLIGSLDEQMKKIQELIEEKLRKANLNRNHTRVSSLAAAVGIIINSDQQQTTITDLAERMRCTTATVRSLAKELETLGIAEKHKHSVKLKTSNETIAEKNPAKEKKSLADVKLSLKDLQVLRVIIENGQAGILQQEIIEKTRIIQTRVNLSVRTLAEKGLVKNRQEGIRSRVTAQVDQIRLQLPDMIKPTEQTKPEITPEKDENSQRQPSEQKKPEEKIAEPEIVQKPPKSTETKTEPNETIKAELLLLSDSLTNKEPGLLSSLPDNRKQQVEDYLNDYLEKGEKISLSVVCSKAGVKKNQAKTFISAIVKTMNKKTDNPNDRIKAIKISLNEDDFENSTIELLSETEFLSELEKDKPPQEKPEEKIVTMNELREKLQNESNVNGTDIAGKPKRTLAQLKATPELCDKQKEILEKLNDAGGSLKKRKIREIFRIKDITLTPYLDFMAKLDVITINGETISLKF